MPTISPVEQPLSDQRGPGYNRARTLGYTFTTADTGATTYVDARGAVSAKLLLDHASGTAGAFSIKVEESPDGVNEPVDLIAAISAAASKQVAGPFGFVRLNLASLASGSLKAVLILLYQ